MTGRLSGKVALITGAARGQGRAHAVRMAEEGAEIIALDLCEQVPSNPYPLATLEDLDETVALVEKHARRAIGRKADVRERSELRAAVADGVAEFGRIDIVVANAGILPMAMGEPDPVDFVDATDVDLIGVMNTVAVALPHLPDAASIIVTGSTAGLMEGAVDNPVLGPGGAGYGFSKRVLVQYVEQMALHLAPRKIRVNAIHPSNCNTHLLHNDGLYSVFRPDLVAAGQTVGREDAEIAFTFFHAMPVPYIEPDDVANLGVFLASDESRYVTGQQIRIDAGAVLKTPEHQRL